MQYDLMKFAKQKAWKGLYLHVVSAVRFSAVVSWSQTTQQFTGHVLDSAGQLFQRLKSLSTIRRLVLTLRPSPQVVATIRHLSAPEPTI